MICWLRCLNIVILFLNSVINSVYVIILRDLSALMSIDRNRVRSVLFTHLMGSAKRGQTPKK